MRGTGWSSVFDAVVCLGVGYDGGVWWWFYLETHVGERTGELMNVRRWGNIADD
jgi:hypothetical protein